MLPFHYISNKPYLISCQHSRSTPSLPHLWLLDSRRHPPAEQHPLSVAEPTTTIGWW
ncbi:hypothetical protein Hanom_Chr11g01022341 [Helianthus anomalus]